MLSQNNDEKCNENCIDPCKLYKKKINFRTSGNKEIDEFIQRWKLEIDNIRELNKKVAFKYLENITDELLIEVRNFFLNFKFIYYVIYNNLSFIFNSIKNIH
jgi:hypothetical protein